MKNYQQALLGAIILEPEATLYKMVEAGGKPEWFIDPKCRMVYDTIVHMHLHEVPVNLFTLTERMRKDDPLFDDQALHDFVDNAPTGAHTSYYIRQVKMGYIKHSAKWLADGIVRDLDEQEHPDKYLDRVVLDLVGLNTNHSKKSKETVISELKQRAKDAKKSGMSGFPSPWPEFNRKFAGLQQGLVTLFAGRGGKGKSIALMNWAVYLAKEKGVKVAWLPLEDGISRGYQRAACYLGGINSFSVDRGFLSPDQTDRYFKALDEAKALPLLVEDQRMTIDALATWAISVKARQGMDVLIIDAFKDILRDSHDTEGDDKLSQGLCDLARRLDVALLVSHHVRKSHDDSPDKKLKSDSIRGSARLHYDARQVFILQNWKDEFGNDQYSFQCDKQNYSADGWEVPMIRVADRCLWSDGSDLPKEPRYDG